MESVLEGIPHDIMYCQILQKSVRPMRIQRMASEGGTTGEGRLLGKGVTWNDRLGTGRRHMTKEN